MHFCLGDKPGGLLNHYVSVSGVVIHWTGSSVGRASSLDNRWSQVQSLSSPIVLTERYFNVVNIAGYNMILGAPWIFQHKVMIGLNPTIVVIGCDMSLPLEGESVTKIASHAMETYNERLERLDDVQKQLMKVAKPICVEALDVDLSLLPLCTINHIILLIDETKVYPWHPSQCPEPLQAQWTAKCDAYL